MSNVMTSRAYVSEVVA